MDLLLSMYDEEFNRLLLLAKCLISQLCDRDDRIVVVNWIKKMCAMKTKDASVKKNRNAFFKYMLTVLHQGVLDEQQEFAFSDQLPSTESSPAVTTRKTFLSRWSADNKTYVAAKSLIGRGALVYMAVSKDPSLGWNKPTPI